MVSTDRSGGPDLRWESTIPTTKSGPDAANQSVAESSATSTLQLFDGPTRYQKQRQLLAEPDPQESTEHLAHLAWAAQVPVARHFVVSPRKFPPQFRRQLRPACGCWDGLSVKVTVGRPSSTSELCQDGIMPLCAFRRDDAFQETGSAVTRRVTRLATILLDTLNVTSRE